MRGKITCALLLLAIAPAPGISRGDQPRATALSDAPGLPANQQTVVVDRIVARIEDDILTLSEMRELGRFQQLANGPGAAREMPGDDELVRQLIDQWIVNTEATVAQFPHPAKEEVQTEVARLSAQFGTAQTYRARLKELELTAESVERQVERQIYLARFLDYKLRATLSVESAEVEKYYREELVPELKKRGQAVPAQEAVEDQIRELLTQREISARVAKWLEDTRSRLKIDIVEKKKSP